MSTHSPSRIDIVCPTFNRSTAIRATIDSVLAQTVEDWTLLVVSDGSTDDTDDIVRAYRDPRIRLLRVESYGHPGGPRNAGVAAATAPFVAYLDHDDRWAPTHLAVLLRLLDGGAAFATTGCVRVDEAGAELDRSGLIDRIWHPELQTVNGMFEPSRVGHVRTVLAELGGWTTIHAGYEDWDLWFRAARHGHDFAIATEHTALLTIGPGSRRNGLRPPQAVVFDRVADRDVAAAVVHAARSEPHRMAARADCLTEMCAWYADLAGSTRYRVADHVPDHLEVQLRADFIRHDKPCLLEELTIAPVGDEWAILLPLWCATSEHAQAIGRVLRDRFPGQFAYLRALIADQSVEVRAARSTAT
ncbi:glycosyltransferase family 2 protein [Nocardia altamirensis]|uniref:glycosyltransferase family 2 protein n=1 Tax=Nocardia altamirensis TaxID=472158 RepID=UPI00083FDDDC|nr:glycosyltransferase [Nocardia altamirensis]